MSLEHAPQRQRRQLRGRFKPLLIPILDAFDMLGVGITKGYAMVNAGVIVTIKIGSRRYATSECIERLATPPEAHPTAKSRAKPRRKPQEEPDAAE